MANGAHEASERLPVVRSIPEATERVLVAVAIACVGWDEEDRSTAFDRAGLSRRIQGVAASLSPDMRRQLVWGTRALQALCILRRCRAFHRLSPERARTLLRSLESSRWPLLRRLHRVLKMLGQYSWYLGEETWASCGYDGPWVGRVEVVAAPPPELGEGLR